MVDITDYVIDVLKT